MELIQEVREDKKLTTFLEKRTKEYEREISCSEFTQHYKNEVEVFSFFFFFFNYTSI
jgi:hypothetical protein